MNKKLLFWESVAIMVGTVIGAGILGIPYVAAKAGFWTGIVNIILLGLVSMFLYLYLGEITLRTNGLHQLTGYAKIYLGNKGKILMMFAMMFGIYGALIAYTIGVGQTLSAIFSGYPIVYSIVFFIIASLIIYLGLKQVAKSELYLLPFIISTILVMSILLIKDVNMINFTAFNFSNIFVPYGVILFAFLGATAIPEMNMELKKNKRYLKKAIIVGMIIPIIIYLSFTILIVGVSGSSTTEVATIGLGEIVGKHMVIIGNIFAMITMATSFLALGLALKQMYYYDYRLNKNISWVLTCLVPFVVVLTNITTFIKALDIAGVLSGGTTGILIVLMAFKAKKVGKRVPEYKIPINWFVAVFFIALFLLGVGYYLWTLS